LVVGVSDNQSMENSDSIEFSDQEFWVLHQISWEGEGHDQEQENCHEPLNILENIIQQSDHKGHASESSAHS